MKEHLYDLLVIIFGLIVGLWILYGLYLAAIYLIF